jgi:hypothetical protein
MIQCNPPIVKKACSKKKMDAPSINPLINATSMA